ncbi:MAG: 50S ribosomal protein L9 [Pseudomonadota bacterium]|nr:50S ribosomal protein L9 [Pseudomonadota bacterium]
MEVILLERIERLGQMGDVVNVKNGYARNYLLPQKKALRKTKDNMAFFESKRKEYEARNLKMKEDAEALAKKLEGLSVVIVRQAAETGQLYGSVTMRDICEAVRDAGFHIERSQIVLNQPFKNLGIFDVKLSLHPDVVQNVRVNIARSEEEAKRATQKKAPKASKAEKAEKPAEQSAEETKAE